MLTSVRVWRTPPPAVEADGFGRINGNFFDGLIGEALPCQQFKAVGVEATDFDSRTNTDAVERNTQIASTSRDRHPWGSITPGLFCTSMTRRSPGSAGLRQGHFGDRISEQAFTKRLWPLLRLTVRGADSSGLNVGHLWAEGPAAGLCEQMWVICWLAVGDINTEGTLFCYAADRQTDRFGPRSPARLPSTAREGVVGSPCTRPSAGHAQPIL